MASGACPTADFPPIIKAAAAARNTRGLPYFKARLVVTKPFWRRLMERPFTGDKKCAIPEKTAPNDDFSNSIRSRTRAVHEKIRADLATWRIANIKRAAMYCRAGPSLKERKANSWTGSRGESQVPRSSW